MVLSAVNLNNSVLYLQNIEPSECACSCRREYIRCILSVRVLSVYFRVSPRTPPVICFHLSVCVCVCVCVCVRACVCVSPHQQYQSHHTLDYHSKLFREGLTDSSQFTMLIPLLPCWNANGSCNVLHALVPYYCFCCFEWVENWMVLLNWSIFQLSLIRNAFGH